MVEGVSAKSLGELLSSGTTTVRSANGDTVVIKIGTAEGGYEAAMASSYYMTAPASVSGTGNVPMMNVTLPAKPTPTQQAPAMAEPKLPYYEDISNAILERMQRLNDCDSTSEGYQYRCLPGIDGRNIGCLCWCATSTAMKAITQHLDLPRKPPPAPPKAPKPEENA